MIFFSAEVIRKYEILIKETAENGKEWDERTITEVEGNREKRDEMAILRIALTSRKVSLTVKYMRYIFILTLTVFLKQTGLPLLHVMLLLGRDESLKRLTAALEAASR